MDQHAFNMELMLLYSVVYGFLIGGTSGLFWSKHKNSTVTNESKTVTTVPPPKNTTSPLLKEEPPFDPVKAEAGAIAGVVFGIAISLVFISIAGIIYIRRKRERDREIMRRATIQRMSKESAGVYTDTTVDTNFLPTDTNNEYFRTTRKDPDIYEDSSEDEL